MGKPLTITRLFDAPRALVWKVWTEPEYVMRWWGPEGFTAPVVKIDLSVGGTYLFCMRSPDGRDYWSTGVYREIIPSERIVATDNFADEKGNIVPSVYYGIIGDRSPELKVTVTFSEQKGRTKFTLLHEGFPQGHMSDLAEVGWNQSLDKFALLLDELTGLQDKKAMTVDEFVETRVLPEFQPVVVMLRKLMREAAPDVKEGIMYGIPAYTGRKPLAVISPTKKGITFAFSHGAEFEDKYSLLKGKGKISKHVKISNIQDIDKDALRYYIRQALEFDAK
ncbi:MAG: SRPBCC domain-containing protein [Methanomicrobiales archaeon]